MKKIISVLLLTILLFADQNSTNQLEQNLSEIIEPLKSENKLPITIKDKPQTDDTKTHKEYPENNIINIIIKVLEANPIILSFIVTIFVVGGGTLITLRNIDKKTEESINTFERTLEQQRELKQKEIIANNRQKWINDLRIEVSKYIKIINTLHHFNVIDKHEKDATEKTLNVVKQAEEYQNITEVETKIALLLNPKEKNHSELYSNMINYKNLIINEHSSEQQYYDQYITYMNTLIDLTRKIIKEEWEKIKK